MIPKQLGFRMPAEWHNHSACWMAFPRHLATWSAIGLTRARKAYVDVAEAIAKYEPVKLLVHPDDMADAMQLVSDKIELVPLVIADSWTRDSGPTFLVHDDQAHIAGVDWEFNAWGENYPDYGIDNQMAKAIINLAHAQYFHAPLVMEGGSFNVDGEGTVLTTRECLLNKNRNPHLSQHKIEQYLCDYLGQEKIIWLDHGLIDDETNGHIDEIACFIAPGKVLALITADPQDANYQCLQANLALLKNTKDAQGRKLEVYTVQQPPAMYQDGERLTLSYINFYHANKGLVIPAFGFDEYDQAAYKLFVHLFPSYEITQVFSLDICFGGGGIHCITQQQPRASI